MDEEAFVRRGSVKSEPDPMDDLSNLSFTEEFYSPDNGIVPGEHDVSDDTSIQLWHSVL